MSWAAHNPEAYEELERNAAVRWLTGQWQQMYNEVPRSVEEEFLPDLVELLQFEQSKIFAAMMDAGAASLVDFSEYAEKFVR